MVGTARLYLHVKSNRKGIRQLCNVEESAATLVVPSGLR